ncbi:MAG: polymer-forming cytoskeletal protein [Gammaproteobacteria bacterium]|nr:polymer-forming cytoskeletal protein [Gammaproteobacteria bacterium]
MIMLDSTTKISNGSSFHGNLSTMGKLIIAGRLTGNTDVNGTLKLTQSGFYAGDIVAKIVIIDGEIEGNISAECLLELHPNARVNGDVVTSSLIIHKGARITGHVKVGDKPKLTVINNEKIRPKNSKIKNVERGRFAIHG